MRKLFCFFLTWGKVILDIFLVSIMNKYFPMIDELNQKNISHQSNLFELEGSKQISNI